MMGDTPPLRKRVPAATLTFFFYAAVWVAVPLALSSIVSETLPTLPIADRTLPLAFGGAVAGLMALGALTKGSPLSVVFRSGAHLTAAAFIWEGLGGGVISVTASGIPVVLTMKTLLFVLVLPSLFSALRVPVEFLLEESEAGGPASELP